MTTKYKTVLLLLILVMAEAGVEQYFDSIVIGAGIAGIGASMTLSNNSVNHLLLQARNRIGGRIATFQFGDTTHQLGAAFIQLPINTHLVQPFVSTFDLIKIPAHFSIQTAWYVNKSICSNKELSTADQVINSLVNYITLESFVLRNDVSVQTLIKKFWTRNTEYQGFIKDRVQFAMGFTAIDNGAELNTISASKFFYVGGQVYANDYAPQKGYTYLINQMFRRYCKPNLHLEEKVVIVDYSGQNIKVTTTKNTYTTNKLFIGVPLGVLKAKKIEFVPPLPKDKADAIDSIGNGLYQKLFVTFSKPFWPQASSALSFISSNSRYITGWVMPQSIANGKNILIFWIGGNLAKQLGEWSFDKIKQDLKANLKQFIPNQVQITNLYLTNWHKDPLTLGGFSYAKVGTTDQHFKDMKSVLKQGNNRIWFIGQYVDPESYAFSHGAFRTGIQAATQSISC